MANDAPLLPLIEMSERPSAPALAHQLKAANSVPIKRTLPVFLESSVRRRTACELIERVNDLSDETLKRDGGKFGETIPEIFWKQRARAVVKDAVDALSDSSPAGSGEAAYRDRVVDELQLARDHAKAMTAEEKEQLLANKAAEQIHLLEDDNYFSWWVYHHRRCSGGVCYHARASPPDCRRT